MKKWMLLLCIAAGALLLTGCGCKHEETELVGVKAATCEEAGYSGDTYCLKCKKTIETGEEVPATGHVEAEPVNVVKATCLQEGYTGDIYCQNCDTLLSEGEVTAITDHTPDAPSWAREATCTEEGSTGVIYCKVCHTLLEEAEVIPALGHTFTGEPENVVEPTCLTTGYAGDQYCSVCEQIIEGDTIAKLPHEFEDNQCVNCEWMVPGLYVDGALEMTWEELVESGYVTLDDELGRSRTLEMEGRKRLADVVETLYGQLVVGEEVLKLADECFRDSQLSVVYLPSDISTIPEDCFNGAVNLEEVRAFGTITSIERAAFNECTSLTTLNMDMKITKIEAWAFSLCTSLTHFEIPEGVTEIEGRLAFREDTALTEVTFPSTLEIIGNEAFDGCENLKTVELNEGLKTIGMSAFNETGLERIVLPSTLTEMYNTSFRHCPNLISVDMSAITAEWKALDLETFSNCPLLEEIILPPNLKQLGGNGADLLSLHHLELPDGLTLFEVYSDAITSVVWPVSLTDGQYALRPDGSMSNLETIYFRGSEFQWSLVSGSEGFEGTVIYNYDGEE